MHFFLDTGDLNEIKKYREMGAICGVTTNPLIVAKHKLDRLEFLKQALKFDLKSISIEMLAENADEMLLEAEKFINLDESVTIKLPITAEGLKACYQLTQNDIKVNMTLCFSLHQALLAAESGATFVSPFIGRAEDNGINAKQLIEDIISAYFQGGVMTQVLAASIRNLDHVTMAALAGVDFITMPPKLIDQMIKHDLTDQGLKQFLDAAKGVVQNAQE